LVAPHVQQEGAISQLDHLGLVAVRPNDATQFPGLAVIVAVDDVGLEGVAVGDLVVAGDDEAAALELNADAWSGGVPGPVRLLDVFGDLDRLRPGDAVVSALRDPDGTCALALALDDLGLGVLAEVVRQQQPDGAGALIDDGTRVAAGVVAVIPDDLCRRPGLAAVGTAAEQQVDVAGVA